MHNNSGNPVSSAHSYLSDLELHNQVVTNIICGKGSWLPDELQHYQNYPKEVERSINTFRAGMPVNSNGQVYNENRLSVAMSNNKYVVYGNSPSRCRTYSTATTCGLAALFANDKCQSETHTAVVVADNENVDVAILESGDGLLEVRGLYGGRKIALNLACDMAWGMSEVSQIDKVMLVGNRALDATTIQCMSEKFGKKPQCYVIYSDMIHYGISVVHGILYGDIHNMLILDSLSMPIGIRVINSKPSKAVQVLRAPITIPTLHSVDIPVPTACQHMDIEVVQGDFIRKEPSRVWPLQKLDKLRIDGWSNGQHPGTLTITADIDANGRQTIEASVKGSNNKLNITHLK